MEEVWAYLDGPLSECAGDDFEVYTLEADHGRLRREVNTSMSLISPPLSMSARTSNALRGRRSRGGRGHGLLYGVRTNGTTVKEQTVFRWTARRALDRNTTAMGRFQRADAFSTRVGTGTKCWRAPYGTGPKTDRHDLLRQHALRRCGCGGIELPHAKDTRPRD